MMKEKITSTLVLAAVIAIGLALVAQYGMHPESVLAKSSSHKSKGSSSSGSSSSSSSSSSGSSSSSSKSSSGKLKTLVSCVTSSAKSSAGLSQSDVMNCYNKAYSNATGTSNSTTPAATATLH
jgi:cellulose 1,4-beta-cellobiosidase